MKTHTWSWWEILLWAYSTLYILFFVAVFLVTSIHPEGPHMANEPATTNIVALILSLPVLIFMIIEGVRNLSHHKNIPS